MTDAALCFPLGPSVPAQGRTPQISQEKRHLLENREPVSLISRQIVAMGRQVSLASDSKSAVCDREQGCSGMYQNQKPP